MNELKRPILAKIRKTVATVVIIPVPIEMNNVKFAPKSEAMTSDPRPSMVENRSLICCELSCCDPPVLLHCRLP